MSAIFAAGIWVYKGGKARGEVEVTGRQNMAQSQHPTEAEGFNFVAGGQQKYEFNKPPTFLGLSMSLLDNLL